MGVSVQRGVSGPGIRGFDALSGIGVADLWPGAIRGIAGWWTTETGLTVDSGNVVSAWADQSGNGVTLTAATTQRPSFLYDAVGGRPALVFNGTGNRLAFNAGLFTGTQECTIVAVTLCGATGSDFIGEGVPGNSGTAGVAFTTIYGRVSDTSDNTSAAVWSFTTGAWMVVSMVHRTSDGITRMRKNGVQQAESSAITLAGNIGSNSPPFQIGTGSERGSAYAGSVSEAVCYTRGLPDDELLQLERYMMQRYAIP